MELARTCYSGSVVITRRDATPAAEVGEGWQMCDNMVNRKIIIIIIIVSVAVRELRSDWVNKIHVKESNSKNKQINITG